MTAPPAQHSESVDNASKLESQSTAPAASASELASTKISLRSALRQFPDFPIPGIDFVDILPLFASPALHETLIRSLELQVLSIANGQKPDVVVGLDARGFLFGPSLALRLGAGFAPVRKRGKLPGPTVEAAFEKEYGKDFFQIQKDAVKPGQTVLVVDDIIATGKDTFFFGIWDLSQLLRFLHCFERDEMFAAVLHRPAQPLCLGRIYGENLIFFVFVCLLACLAAFD